MSEIKITTINTNIEKEDLFSKIWYVPETEYIFNLDQNYKLDFANNINLMLKKQIFLEIAEEKNENIPSETFKNVHNKFKTNYFIKWKFKFNEYEVILVVDPMNLYIQGLLGQSTNKKDEVIKKYYYFNDAVIKKVDEYASEKLMYDGHYQKLMGQTSDIFVSYEMIEKAMIKISQFNDAMVKDNDENIKKYFALIILFSAEALRFFTIRNYIFLIFEQKAYGEDLSFAKRFEALNENNRWRNYEQFIKNWNNQSRKYYEYKKNPNPKNKKEFDSIKYFLTILNNEKDSYF